jgi:hypothetical protein
MNTADFRDMDLTQWAYWATAVPLTIVVILIGLWWMGELSNAFSWLGVKLRSSSTGTRRQYALVPADGEWPTTMVRMPAHRQHDSWSRPQHARRHEYLDSRPPSMYRNPFRDDSTMYQPYGRPSSALARRVR